ncbi:MAG: radical SAM protein [Archangiaceae bacterium]|nr:radical SAM protein [Archangiaceae bacterium]
MQLRVGQIVADTEAEGPGRRFAVWTQGCTLRCEGCCNPHLFTDRGGALLEVDALLARIPPQVEGLSVLGGEPFEQPEAVAALCEGAHRRGLSVMVFSGFTLAELHARGAPLGHVDLLVDGRYVAAQPDTSRRWVGSTNQQVHFLTERGRADAPRFSAPNTVEIRLTREGLSVNGWPQASGVVKRW